MKTIINILAGIVCCTGMLLASCTDEKISDSKQSLMDLIREAETLIVEIEEGTNEGDIAPGSKKVLQTRIDQAYYIMNNTSRDEGYVNARELLEEAIAAFNANIVKAGVPHFGLGSKMNLGASADWGLEDAFTVEMKVRYSEFASGDQSIISNEAGAAGFMVRNNSNQLQFYIYDADINNWNGGGCCTIELNKWYHIAATYQAGGKMVFYLDGVQVSSVNCGTLAASASDLQLGTSPYYSNRYMRGDIQQVSIWNDVRTAAEVAADVACDFDGTEEGLMAYWPLTLNVGTEITDQTGNHVASLVDVTWLDVE